MYALLVSGGIDRCLYSELVGATIDAVEERGIQELLDDLAAGFHASVTLEDVNLHLLGHTEHHGEIDDVRRDTILGRQASEGVQAWFEQWGIRGRETPIRTPAEPTLKVLARWCVPVRFRGIHLGYIWILDNDTLTRDDIEPALETAGRIGALLYSRRVSAQADSDLLRLLLLPASGDEERADEAGLANFTLLTGPLSVAILGRRDGADLTTAMQADLARAIRRAIKQSGIEHVLNGVIGDLSILLIPLGAKGGIQGAKQLMASVIALAHEMSEDLHLLAAVGSSVELHRASRSFSDACRTLRISQAIPDLGQVVAWDELGVFRALALIPPEEIERGVLDPRVRDLLADEELTRTAEAFLDLAGNVQQAATELYLHRATLYQRLDRIASIHGLDLRRNGDHRLIAHLGLKLVRLSAARPHSPNVVGRSIGELRGSAPVHH